MRISIRNLLVGGATAAMAGLLPLAAQADVTLANGNPYGSVGTFGGASGVNTIGEVFTAPVTGTLTSFSLYLDGGVGNLFAGVDDWTGPASYAPGFGAGAFEYQSGSVPSSDPGAYTFNPNIGVVAGHQYVAYLSTFNELTDIGAFLLTSLDVTPGIDYIVYNSAGSPGVPVWDYGAVAPAALFSATFHPSGTVGGRCSLDIIGGCPVIDPNGGGIPEPASWALMIVGFAGAGAVLRRRRALGPARTAA